MRVNSVNDNLLKNISKLGVFRISDLNLDVYYLLFNLKYVLIFFDRFSKIQSTRTRLVMNRSG